MVWPWDPHRVSELSYLCKVKCGWKPHATPPRRALPPIFGISPTNKKFQGMLPLLCAAFAVPLEHVSHVAPLAAPRDGLVRMQTIFQKNPAPLVPDYSWPNVDRWSTNICAARGCGPDDQTNCLSSNLAYSEGLSAGYPMDCGSAYHQVNRSDVANDCNASSVRLNYGCWFTMLPHGMKWRGAAVNVGRSLRVTSRGAAAKTLGLPCGDFPYCDQDYQPWDKLWCTEAQKRGYDSIQIFLPHGPGHETELVICTGCDQAALHGACPPLPLRRGSWDATGTPCNCSDAADNMNCGDKEAFIYCRK